MECQLRMPFEIVGWISSSIGNRCKNRCCEYYYFTAIFSHSCASLPSVKNGKNLMFTHSLTHSFTNSLIRTQTYTDTKHRIFWSVFLVCSFVHLFSSSFCQFLCGRFEWMKRTLTCCIWRTKVAINNDQLLQLETNGNVV